MIKQNFLFKINNPNFNTKYVLSDYMLFVVPRGIEPRLQE